jgi:hypothetical protein
MNKELILKKASLAYAHSFRVSYQFWGLPFGAKQEEIYANDFYMKRNDNPKNSVKRIFLAEDIWKHRHIFKNQKGEN